MRIERLGGCKFFTIEKQRVSAQHTLLIQFALYHSATVASYCFWCFNANLFRKINQFFCFQLINRRKLTCWRRWAGLYIYPMFNNSWPQQQKSRIILVLFTYGYCFLKCVLPWVDVFSIDHLKRQLNACNWGSLTSTRLCSLFISAFNIFN